LFCIESGSTDALATDATVPAPGFGFFYLVRPSDCSGRPGSYDAVGQGQSAPRDASIPDTVCI